MKNINNYIILSLFALFFVSCEDVIDVDLQTEEPRLVIEASLDWEKGTSGNEQTIYLSTSTAYFDTETNSAVTGATVVVTNLNTGTIFNFTDENNGAYTTASFEPILGDTYYLQVNYNGETYEAIETLYSVSEINRITQSTEAGFDDELLEVNIYFDDPEAEENYYLVKYYEPGDLFPFLNTLSDEFVNGNEVYSFFEKEDDEDSNETPFEAGDTVNIKVYAISEQYYNFMEILIEQYYNSGNPFASNAALIKGNCINQDNPDNYAYGYFRVTELNAETYTFQ
ncbi:DUF4249 domain-containing protein [Neotamlana laminarinivorans]|uniref:DUF4249 domain-containing protein n=1 Tax=Neotamlana laminarinivorans TaxID=2883124 RepID=A0A9X1HYV8_9FLAO|nr:DUF4249 domain-containing protein [Tamlana laminarinivorans]MCB4798301.1 DUF4249 domain-containing protein [Tamlana laminarinivorans]